MFFARMRRFHYLFAQSHTETAAQSHWLNNTHSVYNQSAMVGFCPSREVWQFWAVVGGMHLTQTFV